MGIERAELFSRITAAFKSGQSPAGLLRQVRAEGLHIRTSDFYADWHSRVSILEVEGALASIRKDYYPTAKTMAAVPWDFKSGVEFMYTVRIKTRMAEELVAGFVNVMSDRPLTPRQMEEEVMKRWGERGCDGGGPIEEVLAWTAYRSTLI